MNNGVNLEVIQEYLRIARRRQQFNPRDTMETLTYIAHVERLLIEIDNALMMNLLQARNIRTYIEQLERERKPAVDAWGTSG